jgi:hypothetical protein
LKAAPNQTMYLIMKERAKFQEKKMKGKLQERKKKFKKLKMR